MSYLIQFNLNQYFCISYDYKPTTTPLKEEAVEVDTDGQAQQILADFGVEDTYKLIDYDTIKSGYSRKQSTNRRKVIIRTSRQSVMDRLIAEPHNKANYPIALLEAELKFHYPEVYGLNANRNKKYKPRTKRKVDCKKVEYKGLEIVLIDYCEKNNLSFNTINRRINTGWGVEEAIETPIFKVGYKRAKK